MNLTEQRIFRSMYNEACFGAGAEARREARAYIDAMCEAAGISWLAAMELCGCCVHTWWRTRPI